MKHAYQNTIIATAALAVLLITGCQKRTGSDWQDNASALWEKSEGKKELAAGEEDFIPLREEDLKPSFADGAFPVSKKGPGERGSGIPGIEHFHFPTAALASIFRTVFFNTDDHVLRGEDSFATVSKMASYLKGHPKTYLFVEGHCDQRAPQAYNLALGARRANYVRSLLIQQGVDPSQVHTISYGKERPADSENSPQAWAKNRRAQFKLFEQ